MPARKKISKKAERDALVIELAHKAAGLEGALESCRQAHNNTKEKLKDTVEKLEEPRTAVRELKAMIASITEAHARTEGYLRKFIEDDLISRSPKELAQIPDSGLVETSRPTRRQGPELPYEVHPHRMTATEMMGTYGGEFRNRRAPIQ